MGPCGCQGNCFERLRTEEAIAALAREYEHYLTLDHVDQDRVLFDRFRSCAAKMGLSDCDPFRGNRLQHFRYSLFGCPVCFRGCRRIWRAGSGRIERIRAALKSGARAPPADGRSTPRSESSTSVTWGQVASYLQELYDSVAEILPEDTTEETLRLVEDPTAHLSLECAAGPEVNVVSDDVRYLPPGTIYDLWRVYNDLHPDSSTGKSTIYSVFNTHFKGKLRFRQRRQHAVCSTCVKHKLLIQALSDDSRRRTEQVAFYHSHLKRQYADRQMYWYLQRALACVSFLRRVCVFSSVRACWVDIFYAMKDGVLNS